MTKDEWVVWITDGRKDPSFLLLFLDLAAMAIGLYFRSLYQGQLERYDNGKLRPQHVEFNKIQNTTYSVKPKSLPQGQERFFDSGKLRPEIA